MSSNKAVQFKPVGKNMSQKPGLRILPRDGAQFENYVQELLSLAEQRACELATD